MNAKQVFKAAVDASVLFHERRLWDFYDSELCETAASGGGLCVHNNDCSIRSLWSGIQTVIDKMLRDVSLAQLVCNEITMQQTIESLRTEPDAENVGLRS